MDPNEEAGTAASPDCITAWLQTLEDADQARNASDSPVVTNVRSGVVHLVVEGPSNQWSGRPVAGLRCGGLKPHVRFADARESPGGSAEIVVPGVPRAAHP